jgi:hypothetical protein
MIRLREDPKVREKLRIHLQGQTNPFRDPRVREKSIAANMRKGYAHLNGGNGRGPSEPQLRLWEMLCELTGLPWEMEHILRTGTMSPLPTHYKLDIALPSLKICIEVDGKGHRCKKVMESDLRKEQFLSMSGWATFRVLNEQVSEETASSIWKRVQETTLSVKRGRKRSSSTTAIR